MEIVVILVIIVVVLFSGGKEKPKSGEDYGNDKHGSWGSRDSL